MSRTRVAVWQRWLFGLVLLLSVFTLKCALADGVGKAFTGTGNIQIEGFRTSPQVVYAYLGVGEKLRFDIRKTLNTAPPTGADDLTIQIYSPTGPVGGIQTIDGLAALNTGVNNGTVPGTAYVATAATAGIWTIRMTPATDKIYYNYDIDVLNTGNNPINGRVYTSEYLRLVNGSNVTFNLYHINNYGYEYTSTFTDYIGIDSFIRTDRYGITQAGQCVSAYRSAEGSDPTVTWSPTNPCGGIFKQFFTAIDQTMPATANRYNIATGATVSEWLNPAVQPPSVTGLTFTKTLVNPAAGSFTFTVGGYEGNASLQIDANNDGDYVDAVDRTISFNAVLGTNTIAFNGLNGQGAVIGCGLTVGARVLIDKPGEIHFTLSDVEGLGGIQITRTNGPSPNSIIYWNDQSLTETGRVSITPNKNGTAGVNSAVSGGVHGWTVANSNSWGDNRNMDNWAFAAQNVTQATSLTTVCDFGDAPASYSTAAASGGPSHAQLGSVYIGSRVDAETTGIASLSANSDDLTDMDDEDGITSLPPILVECTNTYSITVPVSNTTGRAATLGGWIDFNRNGTFEAREFASVGVPNGATTATLSWGNIQNLGISAGQSYIRLRISTQVFTSPVGSLPDGEVEDYPITIQPGLNATAVASNASACATADGSVQLTSTGGTGSFQYSLNGGAFTAFTSPFTIPNLARGGYTIIVRDASATACADTFQLVVNAPNCCDFNQTQNITVQPYNPGAGFAVQYLLTSTTGQILAVSATPSFPPQAVGSYYIRTIVSNTASPAPTGVTVGQNVSGIRGCCFQLSPPLPIGICDCPTFALLDNNYQVCAGQNLALLRVTTSAAAPTQVEYVYFTTQQTSASAIYGTGGTSLGTATPASNVAQLNNVAFPTTAGTYYVYARIFPLPSDPNCRPYAEIPVTVTTPGPSNDILLSICNNETVNLATYYPGGGSFSAVNGSLTGSTFNGIASGPGSYTVNYTPAPGNGCSQPAIVTIIVRDCSVPPCNYPISSAIVDATCGNSDGRATLAMGGLPTGATVGFAWSNGKTGPSVTGLAAGVYSVTATISTALGTCTVVDQVQVNEIGGPVAEINLISAADCAAPNGAVALNITSGTGPFRISWSGAANGTQNGVNLGTTTLSNLAAGQYVFEVTSTASNTACSSFVHVTIPRDDSDRITLTATPTSATACESATGSIQITATPAVGVTGPFSFSLNGVEIASSSLPTYTINGLIAGAYTVGVSSAGGCSAANIPVVIQETGAPAISGWTAVNPACPTNQGQLVFAGGQPTATFVIREVASGSIVGNNISGASSTTLTLPAGTYSIEQTGTASNCSSFTTVTISRPEGLDFNVQYTKVTCAPGGVPNNDGSISIVQITGGTAPYTSTVLNAQNQAVANLQAVSPGMYSIRVVDSRGCPGIENVFVTVPDCELQCPKVPMNTFVVDANCTSSDGRAVAQLGAYDENDVDYQWSNGFSGKNTNGLASGVYSVTATVLTGTFTGCTYVETINVNQIGGPVVSQRTINPSSCAANTGSVSFSLTSGTGPYTVTWNGPVSSSRTVNGSVPFQFTQTGLAPGDYIFTFKSTGSDCQTTLDVTIPVSSSSNITLAATPNPASGCGAQDGSISLTASGSGPNYIFSLNGVAYTSVSVNTATIPNLPAGVYTVGVGSGSNGCETERMVVIQETGAPTVTGWSSQSATCAASTGSITYAGGSGTGTYRVMLGGTEVATTAQNVTGPVVFNLPQGIYTVELRDGACTSYQSLTITGPVGIDFNVQYIAETCGPGGVGNGDGTLNVIQINGGTAPYAVSIINNEGQSFAGASHSNLLAGNYFVSVVDANGCRGNEDALVTVPPCEFKCPPLAFNTSVIDNQCGQTSGSAKAELLNVPSGATPTYLWSNGQNGPVATGLASGVYSVTATLFADNTIYAGCAYVDTVNVNDIGGPIVSVSATAGASCTTANGSVALNIAGGTGAYTIAWTGTATGSQTATNPGLVNISGLRAGNYVFTVTGSNSTCKSVMDVTIPTRTPNGFTLAVTPAAASGCGASDGRLTINVSGGTGPFTYSVNGFVKGVSTTRSFSVQGLPAGVYEIDVMDANGCMVSRENVLINPNGQTPIAGWSPTNATCPSDNGTLQFAGTGSATDEYVVTIAGTATEIGRTPGNVAATYTVPGGTYLITRAASTSCVSVTTITIAQPDGLDFNIQYQNPNCTTPNSGSLAIVQPTGGTTPPPYSYTVTGPTGVVSNLTALSSGSYTVTMGDGRGCTFSNQLTLTDGANLTLTAAATPAVVCVGQPISLSATASGSNPPLLYAWSGSDGFAGTGQTVTANATTSGLHTYTVVVTDATGCTAVQSTTVTVGAAPIATATPATVCAGETVTLEATAGGTSYAWSGPNFATVTNVPTASLLNAQPINAGVYSVTITGGNGCTGVASTTVTVNAAPVVTALVNSITVCVGGSLVLTASASPTASYTYTWSGPNNFTATGATVTRNNALATYSGSYTVVATSTSGCSSSAVVTDPVTVTLCCQDFGLNVVATNAHCGQSDGGATITASGGTPGYTYAWSNGASSSTVSAMAPGSYTVTVSDAVGCSTTALVTIGNVDGPQIGIASVTPATCLGATGAASVTVTGGTGSYSYVWSNGTTGSTISAVVAGIYSVTVTDAAGCSDVLPVEILTEPGSLTTTIASTPSACGQATGTVSVTASGGTPAYQYVWNTGATSSSIANLVTGVYSVTVTDANQCSVTANVNINDLTGPTVAVSGTAVSCNGTATGSAVVLASGGTAPYTYAWSNGMTSSAVNGLSAGTYSVIVTDANGCQASDDVTISQPAAIEAELSSSTIACGSTSGSITLVNITGGTQPYSYLWSNGATTASLTNVGPGSYNLIITDANGCVAQGTASLLLPTDCTPICDSRTISLVALNPECGQSNGVITATLSGSFASGSVLAVNWLNLTTGAIVATNATSVSGLAAGSYSISVTLTTGSQVCSYSAVTSLTDVGSASLVVASTTATDCGVSTGTANLQITGTGSFTVTYTGPVSGSLLASGSGPVSLTNLAAGTYGVSVRDANGCVASDDFVIEPAGSSALSPQAVASAATCATGDGSVTVSWNAVSGATSYSVTVGAQSTVVTGTSATFTGLPGGSYPVTVSLAGSATCGSSSTLVTIPTTNGPALAVNAVQPLCAGETGVITISAPQPGITYSLFNETGTLVSTGTSFTLGSGNYVVSAASTNCVSTTAVVIEAPTGINFNVSVSAGLCGEPGSLTVLNQSGGSGSYTTTITNSAGATVQPTSLLPDSYTVTVSDANGCTASQSVTITTGTSLSITTSVTPAVVCVGSPVSLSATVIGATEPLQYVWTGPASFSATGQTIQPTVSVTGSYTVVVTSANGCSSTAVTAPVTATVCIPCTKPVLTVTGPECNTANNTYSVRYIASVGAAVTASVGTLDTTQHLISGIIAGQDVVITAANACGEVTSSTVLAPTTCTPPAGCTALAQISIGQAVCQDGTTFVASVTANRGATITAFGGTVTNGIVTGTVGTNVTVVATIAGCSSVSAIIGTPVSCTNSCVEPLISLAGTTCNFTNYSVKYTLPIGGTIVVSAGTLNTTTQTITNIPLGQPVSITVTNGSCPAQVVEVPAPTNCACTLSLTANVAQSPICANTNAGLVATVTGGSQPFTYSWSGPNSFNSTQQNPVIINAQLANTGSYTLIVTDAAGCSATAVTTTSLIVQNCPNLCPIREIGIVAIDPSCGDTNGSATAELKPFPSGGLAQISYQWTNLGTNSVVGSGPAISGLAVGIYTVQINVTSNNQTCSYADTVALSNVGSASVAVGTIVAADCGQTNGSASVTILTGAAPFTVQYTGAVSGSLTTPSTGPVSLTGLTAGDYFVRLTDANGCVSNEIITIPSQAAQQFALSTQVTPTSVCGSNDGQITVSWQAVGSGPYQVSLNGVTTTVTTTSTSFTGLSAGSYQISVGTSSSCNSGMTMVTVPGSSTFTITGWTSNSATCAGEDGSLSFAGNQPGTEFTISYPNGSPVTTLSGTSSATAISVAPGNYVVTGINASGCTSSTLLSVGRPAAINFNIQPREALCGQPGSLTVTNISGGTGPYAVAVFNGNTLVTNTNSLSAGTYQITVTDNLGCFALDSVTITGSSAPLVQAVASSQTVCVGGSPVSLSATVTGSTQTPFTYVWSGPASFSSTAANPTVAISSTAITGIYSVTVTDNSGCSATSTVGISASVCSTCFTAKVYLQGSLLHNGDLLGANNEPLMRDDLRALGYLPAATPYGTGVYANFPQVANPVAETITPGLTAITGESAIVDWVFLELRSKTNPAQVLYTRSGLVQRNGTIVDVNGQCLDFNHVSPDSYFVSVRHRNHLGVMTQEPVAFGAGSDVTIDFRTRTPQQIWDKGTSINALYADRERYVVPYATSYYALWGGNANRNSLVAYQGPNEDLTEVYNQVVTPVLSFNSPSYVLSGYYSGDIDMNGETVYQGQNDEPTMIFNILVLHPSNLMFNSPSFENEEQLP